MICRFRKRNVCRKAFSLLEVSAAVAILGIVSSSVVLVISRTVAAGTNSVLRMQAFEVARENMEKLLASDQLKETADFGESELYPGIEWETTVETFYEPMTSAMWVKGICVARYTDVDDQEQTVELTHWLTDVTEEQMLQMMDEQGDREQWADQLIETVEEAALYAGVGVETIEQWLDDGMLITDDGSFIKGNLDIYMTANGDPSPEERQRQVSSEAGLRARQEKSEDLKSGQGSGDVDPKTGLTYEKLEQMDFSEVYELMKNRRR